MTESTSVETGGPNPPILYIDSHTHLHDTAFFPDNREEIYEQSRAAGVTMICVGTDVESSRQAVEFARSHQGCYAVVGIHPHEAKHGGVVEIRALLEAESLRTQNSKLRTIIGIGEIGLDYFYEHSPADVQQQLLREQLALAREYNLPVSFHVRDAFGDFWPILDEFPGLCGVMHSFTDTQDNLNEGIERGLYVGINGISTFTKDENQLQLYRDAPLERILLETDAPFLTPKPLRGKVNVPAYVELVAKHQATLKGVPLEEIAAQTTANAKKVFGI